MISLLLCIFSIALIIIKGKPQNEVSLNSVSEVGESILHHIDKVGHIFTSVSDQEEVEIGEKIHKKIFKAEIFKGIKDVNLDKYINDVGNKVAENVKRKNIKYKFRVIESFWPNAFSIPGGHVYVTTKLLEVLRSEAELAAVLGHEIAHIDAKHCIGNIQYKIATEKVLGETLDIFVNIGYGLLLKPGYSELQESEADMGSVYLTYKTGYHPLALAYAFEQVGNAEVLLEQNKNPSETPVGETIKAVAGILGRYFNTHPHTLDRIRKIKKYVSDNKLINNRKFYIGQKNYKENIALKEKQFEEEFKKDYAI